MKNCQTICRSLNKSSFALDWFDLKNQETGRREASPDCFIRPLLSRRPAAEPLKNLKTNREQFKNT